VVNTTVFDTLSTISVGSEFYSLQPETISLTKANPSNPCHDYENDSVHTNELKIKVAGAVWSGLLTLLTLPVAAQTIAPIYATDDTL